MDNPILTGQSVCVGPVLAGRNRDVKSALGRCAEISTISRRKWQPVAGSPPKKRFPYLYVAGQIRHRAVRRVVQATTKLAIPITVITAQKILGAPVGACVTPSAPKIVATAPNKTYSHDGIRDISTFPG